MSDAAPTIELLWWEGCPSTPEALADVRAALREAGLDPESVGIRRIGDEAEASRAQFAGSPTVRVDGVDVDPAGAAGGPALTCRVYRRRDGRVSPTPDPDDLRDAIGAAVAARRSA